MIGFPPLDNWKVFERLILAIFRKIEPIYKFTEHARSGQRQMGVDIIGQTARDHRWLGIQCKRVQDGTLTETSILEELTKSDAFEPPLDRLIIATTIRRDGNIQALIRLINEKRMLENKHTVEILFWDDLCEVLNQPKNRSVAKEFYPSLFSSTQSDWFVEPVITLCRDHFALGDHKAANFHYITKPIEYAWLEGLSKIKEVCHGESKSGLIISGPANSGKTRMGLELILSECHERQVVRLDPADFASHNYSVDAFAGDSIVLFIDDLQRFIEPLSKLQIPNQVGWSIQAPLVEFVSSIIAKFRAVTQSTIIVATFRQEDEIAVRACFQDILLKCFSIELPTFSRNLNDVSVKQLIEDFDKQGIITTADWDGTIGSLLLGLEKKRQQYAKWVLYNHPASVILKAVKLLGIAKTPRHSQERIQAICAEIFGTTELRDKYTAWQNALDMLIAQGFILDDQASPFVVRMAKDDYLERVVDDYPPSARPSRLESDLIQLREVFRDLKDADGLSNLGTYYYDQYHYSTAISLCEDAISINPESWAAWNNKGNSLHALHQDDEAFKAYEHAISLAPDSAFAWNNMAAFFGDLQRPTEALAAAQQGILLDPNNAVTYVNKAAALSFLGDNRSAIDTLETALRLNSSLTMAWHNLIIIHYEMGAYEKGLAIFDRAVTEGIRYDPIFVNASILLGKLGRQRDAEDMIDCIPEGSRYRTIAWCNLGCILIEQRNFAAAIEAFDRALVYDPTFTNALATKGAVLCDLGRYYEGLALCKRAVEIDKSSFVSWVNKGNIHRALGMREGVMQCFCDAILCYDMAIDINSNNADVWAYKALALASIREYKEALGCFDRSLAINPEHPLSLDVRSVVVSELIKLNQES